MNLKTATILAIVGAAVAVALGVINLITRFVPALSEIIYAGHGIVVGILWILVSVTYLMFFITLYGKQK